MEGVQTIGELQENLNTYREQLQQVNELLKEEPENEEYKEMAAGLKEVIDLTEDLLSSALQAEGVTGGGEEGDEARELSSSHFQQTESVPGGRLELGTSVKAFSGEDNQWWEGSVQSLTTGGYFVKFDHSSKTHEIQESRVRRVEEDEETAARRAEEALARVEREAEETKLGLKRKMAEAAKMEIAPRAIPPKLRINPDDPEDVKAEKKRKIHGFKSRQRLEMLEIAQNKKQNAWQQFTTKGSQKKTGFLTGRKKESIFKSPDDVKGKVGVVGSGHGMTEFQKREKHLNLKAGSEGDYFDD